MGGNGFQTSASPLKLQGKGGTVMKITIVGRQLNVRDDQRAMVEKKLAKFDKFF